MANWDSCVAMISVPVGPKKASSGSLKVCPGERSPGDGYCQMILPLGSTSNSLEFPSSAIRIGPGSAEGFEPGWRFPCSPLTFASSEASQDLGLNEAALAADADEPDALPVADPPAAEEWGPDDEPLLLPLLDFITNPTTTTRTTATATTTPLLSQLRLLRAACFGA